jgi:ribonuclease P protein component
MANLNKHVSLKKQQDFSRVFSNNIFFQHPPFTLLIGLEAKETTRLGIVITKKNHSLATDRNLIKRISKEAFRASQLSPNKDIILLVGSFNVQEMRTNLFSTIYNIFEKINTELNSNE